jgi:outer membrane protein assembly factor BamB
LPGVVQGHSAEYPGGTIGRLDRRQHFATVGAIPRSALQNRPRDVYYDSALRQVLVASMAAYGYLDGALTTYDPQTGDTHAYRGIVDDQTVNSVVTHRGIAYLATQVGSSGIEPTTTEAHLAAFDVATGDVLWRDVPLPGVATIRHIEYLDGLLYAYTGDGRVFSYDPGSREVVDPVSVGGAGEVEAWNGRLFAATGDAVLELDPATLEPTTLGSCLAGGWYNEPQSHRRQPGDALHTRRSSARTPAAPRLRRVPLSPLIRPARSAGRAARWPGTTLRGERRSGCLRSARACGADAVV